MKWNINIVYRMIYTVMTLVCAGFIVVYEWLEKQEIKQFVSKWKEGSVMAQLGWLAVGIVAFFVLFAICYWANGHFLCYLQSAIGQMGIVC